MTLLAAFQKEMMEQARTSRLLVLAAVLLFFGLTSPLVARYTPEMLKLIPGADAVSGLIPTPTLMDAVGQFIKNIDQFGILLALLLTMGVVAVEKERGTAAMLLVKPLPRPAFLLAKFAALALMFAAVMFVTALGAYYYTVILFTAPDFGAWMAATALMWVQILVYIALTLLFSTLFRSQAAAAGLGFGVILVFALLSGLSGLAPYIPDRLLAWGVSLFTPAPMTAWPAMAVSLGIILVSLVAAVAVFQKQEL